MININKKLCAWNTALPNETRFGLDPLGGKTGGQVCDGNNLFSDISLCVISLTLKAKADYEFQNHIYDQYVANDFEGFIAKCMQAIRMTEWWQTTPALPQEEQGI